MKLRTASRKFFCPILLSLLPLAAVPAVAAPGDDAFLQARDAFATGNRIKLAKAIDNLQGHELRLWAEYYQLRQQVDENPSAIARFSRPECGQSAGRAPAQ